MKIIFWLSKLLLTVTAVFLLSPVQAGIPLWTFDPITDTEISITTSGTAIIQYVVTNQSRRTHILAMKPIRGINQIVNGGCSKLFKLGYRESCTLTLQVIGSQLQRNVIGGPDVCEQANSSLCYQPGSEDILKITRLIEPGQTTLSTSVSTLALKTSGTTRIITITNRGTETATNVAYRASPALPAGTTITPSRCGTIAPEGTCVLRIKPGATPSATPGDTNPIAITLTIAGDNTNTLTPTLNILAYGSVYQSGYIFAFNDTTPNTGSVGGKVAALQDQAPPISGIIWSSDGSGGSTGDVAEDNIPGIYETSVNPPAACDGNSDGACNTNVIVAFYPAVNLSFYAAGRCQATIGGYSDWYLPAICEMGYDALGANSGCGIPPAPPTLQNMQTNLVDNINGNIGGLFGPYWASTEFSSQPADSAWVQLFLPLGAGSQGSDDKFEMRGVRCVRALTP